LQADLATAPKVVKKKQQGRQQKKTQIKRDLPKNVLPFPELPSA
jgi:hypothetical protein